MTPKEKAEELVEKMLGDNNHYLNKNIEIDKLIAKQCALHCVEEILNDNPNIYDSDRLNHKYWKEVKRELNQNKESEQLCDCRKHSIKTNYGFEVCAKCGNEFDD